ncbi:MAG: alpha/beta hydrolase fold protein [Rhodospirillaceae bacterium]|nr:MAG: alpha/beta hydrolase fold protein [Rhodospirillaceae bacterium]
MPASFHEHWIPATDGIRLYWRDYGNGARSDKTPLLCLTGLTRNAKDFHFLAKRYAGTRRVLCPDYRGRGRSDYDPQWQRYTPATYAQDMRCLLAACGIERVVVIGTSLGGIVAMDLAMACPASLAGVVLNDVGPVIDTSSLRPILDRLGVDRPQTDWDGAVRETRRMFPTLVLPSEKAWLSMAQSTFRAGADGVLHVDWDVNLMRPLREETSPPDLWPAFRALGPLPALALRGETSDVLSVATFDRMAEAKPDLVRATIPGAGHTPHLGEPQSLAALDRFLATV